MDDINDIELKFRVANYNKHFHKRSTPEDETNEFNKCFNNELQSLKKIHTAPSISLFTVPDKYLKGICTRDEYFAWCNDSLLFAYSDDDDSWKSLFEKSVAWNKPLFHFHSQCQSLSEVREYADNCKDHNNSKFAIEAYEFIAMQNVYTAQYSLACITSCYRRYNGQSPSLKYSLEAIMVYQKYRDKYGMGITSYPLFNSLGCAYRDLAESDIRFYSNYQNKLHEHFGIISDDEIRKEAQQRAINLYKFAVSTWKHTIKILSLEKYVLSCSLIDGNYI